VKKLKLFSFFFILPVLLFGQQSKIDSVLAIINKHTRDSSEVRALNWLAKESEKKDTPTALRYYREAIRISENYEAGPWVVTSYIKIALLLSRSAQNDSARFYIDKATPVLERYPKNNKLLHSYYNALGLFNKNIGNYEVALKCYESIAAFGEAIIGKEEVAGNYLNIANIYNATSKFSLSQDYHFRALKIFEELKNETGIAFCYNGLGIQFYKQKNYSKAESYFKKSLVLKKKIGNKKAYSSGFIGLAVLYMDLKDYSQALENINLAISICEEFNMKDHLCEGLINKGMIYHFQDRQKEAHECFAKAKTLAEELRNANLLAKVNVELGGLYQDQSNKDRALASLLQGIEQAKRGKNLDFEQSAHRHLADLYYSNGQFKEAFEEFRVFHMLYDSLEGSSVKMQLYDMEAKYETQKKETEIALLKKDQQLRATAIREQNIFQTVILVALVLVVVISILFFNWYRVINRTRRQLEIERVRNNIAQDLHDDIGSTLSSINIISKMAAQNPVNENANNNFAQIEDHSGKMLSTMADIIWSINPGNDMLDEIVIHMKEFAAEILEPKNINYHFQVTGNLKNQKIDVVIRKNIFLIFKEALNNAMKYSHCTEISINLVLASTRLTLDIVDNGDGFDFQQIRRGNGLNNMKERAALMNGQLEIKTAQHQGTHIVISVTIA
jgi:two-component system, NarL family, sensor histidine kinase UhpB